MKYYLKNNKLPVRPDYLVQVWPLDKDSELLAYFDNCNIGNLYKQEKMIKWKQGDWNYDNSKRTLIYANRNATMRKLSLSLSNVIVEAGIKDIRKRQNLRKQFMESDSGIFLFDGGYAGGFPKIYEIDELLFADIPFSSCEAAFVLEQVSAKDDMQALVLFDQSSLDFNRHYLARIYPNLDTIRSVLFYFKKKMRSNPIREELNELAVRIADFIGENFNAFDLFPVLRILSDLGLCRTKKAGSIIEIKFITRNDALFDISISPYYLEGLAEKTAFSAWETEVNKFLMW